MSGRHVIKEGWLLKRSRPGRAIPNWKKRYFRLSRTELVYYRTPQDPAPRRRYELTLDSKVLRSNDQGYSNCLVFQPAPGQPNFYMQAENEVEKEEWITAIYNAYRRTPDVAQQTPIPEAPRTEPASPRNPQDVQPPPAPPAAPARILLNLVVEEARKLRSADFNGKSDPYCIVKLVGKDGSVIDIEEKRTDVITATLDPVWKKPFTLGRVVDLTTVKAIQFDLWDHDTFSRHDSLGSVRVPFSRFRMSPASTGQSEPVDGWFKVEAPQKTSRVPSPRRNENKEKDREKEHAIQDWGELRVKMSISGPNLVDFFQSPELSFTSTSPVATASLEHRDNRLEVTVIAAKGLISSDLNDSSDPYCELILLDDHGKAISGEYARTATMHRTRNPAWPNEHHVFGLICPIERAASLKVRVIDYDKSNRNDPLGFVLIGLDQLSAHKWTEWHALQPEAGMATRENLGEIQLKVWLIGERRGERARQLKIDKEVNTKTHNQSVEQLELENAQFQLHDAVCKLDGSRIPCAVSDYQERDPRFYGINGCIHYLNTQIPRAHREKTSSDEGFQARSGLEGQAVLEVAVIQVADLKKEDKVSSATPYAVIEIDPAVCVEECKRTSAPLSPQKSKRLATLNTAAAESRNTMFSKRTQAEVSLHRTKLVRNEMRSEKTLEINPDVPVLKVDILTGHELSPADMNGYSDPYCTLSITDRNTGKPVEAEKKRTAVVSKTLNPVWTNESFVFGQNMPLSEAGSLLIHVKDHNNIGRSTPLGRVQISLYDLCRASADSTSIASRAVVKRYALTPEPWMKKHAAYLGELCIKTEVVGDATVLAELMQRASTMNSLEKSLSILSFSSDVNMQSESVMEMSATDYGGPELEDEITEVVGRGAPICTSTVTGNTAAWRKEKFTLSLSYPGVFSDAKYASIENYSLHLRVHEARNLITSLSAKHLAASTSVREFDAAKVSEDAGPQLVGRRSTSNANIYFTVIPVLGDGRLEDAERKQSLTVYDAHNPCWPEQHFVFGQVKDISNVSYLSLHVYQRDLEGENKKSVLGLLTKVETMQLVRLKRFQVHKLSPSGEVDDDGLEVLHYGQRVLAFRRCHNGGRFYPALIEMYIPFPHDEYDVRFEDNIETIQDLWNFFSLDVKGKVQAIRSDGRVDLSLDEGKGQSNPQQSQCVAKTKQLIPISTNAESVDKIMARCFDPVKELGDRWQMMKHTFSGLMIDVVSVSKLLVPLHDPGTFGNPEKPGVLVTFLGKSSSPPSSHYKFNDQGELVVKESLASSKWSWETNKRLEGAVAHGSAENHGMHFLQQNILAVGKLDCPVDDTDQQRLDAIEEDRGTGMLSNISSILLRVVETVNTPGPCNATKLVGFAKIDLATLRSGQQDLRLQVIPPEDSSVPYYKSAGSVFVRITCFDTKSWYPNLFTPAIAQTGITAEAPEIDDSQTSVCGFNKWYERQMKVEAQSPPSHLKNMTRIERRRLLRASLTPTENSQIDAFHTVLVIIMKRIVNILQEIRLFEEFELLSDEEMRKCRQTHTVNADPGSEWLGRSINELSVETRKDIVVQLEIELLDLAVIKERPKYPTPDMSREEWVRLRTERQKLLHEQGTFFMRDQASVLVFNIPRSFTGEGMVTWIQRSPSVLWEDQWVKYCRDDAVKASCKLGWGEKELDKTLDDDVDAIQAPTTRGYAVQWLSALCAAGYIENVTPSVAALTDLGKRNPLMEDRTDRYYRLRDVEMWMDKLPREKSLFPLDLVQEIDIKDTPTLSMPDYTPRNDETGAKDIASSDIKNTVTFAKKLTEHCDGFLGMHTVLSNLLLSPEVKKLSVLKPVADKTQQLFDDHTLWGWKYCIFVSSRRCLYMYEDELSVAPVGYIDMTSAGCRAAYNTTNDKKDGWMDIINATMFLKSPSSPEFVPVSADLNEETIKTRENGDKVIELKAHSTQRWIQAFTHAGISIDMRPGQAVLMKRLNPTVLEKKCVDYATEFDPNDLEGSFHRLLNHFFGHDKDSTHQDHENMLRKLRGQVRNELKKTGAVGDTVMAYYGKGKRLKSKPAYGGNFVKDSLYSGRIVRIRTPFTDKNYGFPMVYDVKNKEEVPDDLSDLLNRYSVTDKASWLRLPKTHRDLFLLYDVEYSHNNERFVEEGLMREHIRTNEGDLDPKKVSDRCMDLNILFKSTDLENCVTRMVKHRYEHKPLGVVKIPIKTISPHRAIDAWYPLAPARDMLQKANLGQIRLELKLVHDEEVKRSKKFRPLPEDIKREAQLLSLGKKKSNSSRNLDSKKVKKSSFVVGREPSFVKVTILEGKKLRVADMLTSDPFVEIVLVHEESKKEYDTNLKTDIKMRTLNPKWENQEFVLGRTESTALSNKKSILLRVMDYDATSANDPLGCVRIEFQRSKMGYIRGLVLEQADPYGSAVVEELILDEQNRAEVDAMLLPAPGQSKPKAKKTPTMDGLLGKLRFTIEIMRNENYVDFNQISNAEIAARTKLLEAGYSAEIAIKSAVVQDSDKGARSTGKLNTFDWDQYTCYFQPHGEGGLRIQYDAASEDLGYGNMHKLSELIRCAEPLRASNYSRKTHQLASHSALEAFKILGRTYDVGKVDYFDVVLVSDTLGKVFEGKLGATKSSDSFLRTPAVCATFQNEEITLADQDKSGRKIVLTVDLNFIGILRADRVKKVLADTFRMVGLAFDYRSMNQSNGRCDPTQLLDNVQAFLWDTCQANIFPGRNIGDELLSQVRIMSQASKLHWKATPQLLAYVFEFVFQHGARDRLSYPNTIALDNLLNRWSLILNHISEAKTYSSGSLHGKKTPQIVKALFNECDWTGFEFASIHDGDDAAGDLFSKLHNEEPHLQIGERISARLPSLKHAGVSVDVLLPCGRYIPAMITGERSGDLYCIRMWAGLRSLRSGETPATRVSENEVVFVCPVAHRVLSEEFDSAERKSTYYSCDIANGRLGRVKQYDQKEHADSPYLVEYEDDKEPCEEWQTFEAMNATFSNVLGSTIVMPLQKDTFVRVSAEVSPQENSGHRAGSTSAAENMNQASHKSTEPSRPGKVVHSHGNSHYDICYLDDQLPVSEDSIQRSRLVPVSEKPSYDGTLYDGTVVSITSSSPISSLPASAPTLTYSVHLHNGELVENVARNQLRLQEACIMADVSFLGAIFVPNLQVYNRGMSTIMADKLTDLLWSNNKVVKVYAMLPAAVKSVQIRDPTANKLLQTELMERSEASPRFLGQYHGFIKGENMTKDEEKKLAEVYAATNSRRTSSTSQGNAFIKSNCFCLVLAPPPMVRIRGAVRVSPSSDSDALFKLVLSAALNKSMISIKRLIQKMLREESNACLLPGHKERIALVEKVTVGFITKPEYNFEVDFTAVPLKDHLNATPRDVTGIALSSIYIEVKFQISVPHEDKGSLAESVNRAFSEATTICNRVQGIRSLVVVDSDIASAGVDNLSWRFERSNDDSTLRVLVNFTNLNGKLESKPAVSVELGKLHNVRIKVCDVQDISYDVDFPIRNILVEARVRRQLSPFVEAKVRKELPIDLPIDGAQDSEKRLTSEEVRDSTISSFCCLDFVGRESKKAKSQELGPTPRSDVKLDMLTLKVLNASKLMLKESVGSGDTVSVEAMLISSDFQPGVDVTPFGLTLSSSGEILKDTSNHNYPAGSTFELKYDKDKTEWMAKASGSGKEKVVFSYPHVSLDRVSHLSLKLKLTRQEKFKSVSSSIGMVDIPLDQIRTQRLGHDDSKDDKKKSFSVLRKEHGRMRVVGTISLIIERLQHFRPGEVVFARRLETETDFWRICPREILTMTLDKKKDKLTRSLLASGSSSSSTRGGKQLLEKSEDMELQLQKLLNVELMLTDMGSLSSPKTPFIVVTATSTAATNGIFNYKSADEITSRVLLQLQRILSETKSVVRGAVDDMGFGEYITEKRLPWSSDPRGNDNDLTHRSDIVVVEANVATCSDRVRHAVLKLHKGFLDKLIPKLIKLYELDSQGDRVDIVASEKLLAFFEKEVEELDAEDEEVRQRLYQRVRLNKLTQVLEAIMRATVRVKIMDEDRNVGDKLLGTACIPLMDLLDQQVHDNMYQLMNLSSINLRGNRSAISTITSSQGKRDLGSVRLRLQLKLSESAFLEQAISVYKIWKVKYVAQHEAARRRIHAAVVPAQRRRWITIQSYLDELTKQANGKLHWERTPVLLSLVWDIFATNDDPQSSSTKSKEKNTAEREYSSSVTQMAAGYRESVLKVHKRWANLQPMLEELMGIQAAEKIHAERTPQLLDAIEKEVEGLDVGLATAWQQVQQKWQTLYTALEELVRMQERNKLHLGRAPQLLNVVDQRCSKGLNTLHADAVSNVQFRWMAITQRDGPLAELRLMEKKGLHWQRTLELVMLLKEQCEGFADVDATALDIVENRWKQVQEWLDDIVRMQTQHSIDCELTPFVLEKMHLLEPAHVGRQADVGKPPERPYDPKTSPAPSPRSRNDSGNKLHGLQRQFSSRDSSQGGLGVEDCSQLEGMAEWYAIEEAKYELERIPYHRITTESDRKSWLLYSKDGKDTRLFITQAEMVYTPANVRLALEDRGVIPKTSNFDQTSEHGCTNDAAWATPSAIGSGSGSKAVALPKELIQEIEALEKSLENRHDNGQTATLPNPERVAELYVTMENLGKSDMLWKVDNAVSRNRELSVPENYQALLRELTIRQIPTIEVENLVKSLAFTLQKEALISKGIDVPPTANYTMLLQLMHRHQVKEVILPQDTTTIQTLLQDRGMDRKGEPVMLRGIRIGTRVTEDSDYASPSNVSSVKTRPLAGAINSGLGIIDTQIELLRKSLLFEALRKRNSLARTFAGDTRVLEDEDDAAGSDVFSAAIENAQVDMSGDYMTLVERFQRLLVHESYTKRLAEYAALDRCMRALLGAPRDRSVTKEEIAAELKKLNDRTIGANYRLPVEAFTEEELLDAARAGRIRDPSKEMLKRCPRGRNARAMAFYAAMSYAANAFQEATSFRSRVDPNTLRLQDAFPFEARSSLDGVAVPKDRGRVTVWQSGVNWLLGSEASTLTINRRLTDAHRQRLQWASAAFTLRNRWIQQSHGWCDGALGDGVGVKVLLERLLLFEAANKMHMVQTEALLKEIRDKCERLRAREREAQAKLEERYQSNLELLEKLVTHAERCLNNRKLHSEETPVLLHKLEQVCVVPSGLDTRHREAYHVVTVHWLPHRQHLAELVKMHKEGTFSITRTPELLGQMNYHTEGKAGAEELSEDKVAVSAEKIAPGLQETYRNQKLNEVRRGQRKEPSSLHLNNDEEEPFTNQSADETEWKELAHAKRVAKPLSPHEKQTSWKLVRNVVAANAVLSAAVSQGDKLKVEIEPKAPAQPVSHQRKLSLGDELKELIRSPSKWLMMGSDPGPQVEAIPPELYFPQEVILETSAQTLTGPQK